MNDVLKSPEIICELCKCVEVIEHDKTSYHITNVEYKEKLDIILDVFLRHRYSDILKAAQKLPIIQDKEDKKLVKNITANAYDRVTSYGIEERNSIDTLMALIKELKLV